MDPQNPKPDLPWIDGLRATAAIAILLFHLNPVLTAFFGAIPLLDLAFLGVDVFFALSGFLVFYHHRDQLFPFKFSSYRKFLLGRLARIYPLHVFILAVLAFIVFLAPHAGFVINRPQDYQAIDFGKHLLLVSAWSFPAQMTWNHYAWAISVLWMMYLLSPFLIRFIQRMEDRSLVIVSIFVLIFMLLGIRLAQPYESFVSYAIFRAFTGFGIGMLLCRLFSETSMPQTHFGTQKSLRFIARMSYALYMVQFLVIMTTKKAFPVEVYAAASFTVRLSYVTMEIAAVFVLSLAAHYLIEEPARRLLSKKIR